MKSNAPLTLLWWLVSRASGIVALVLVSLVVLMGLAMAARVIRPPLKRSIVRVHEHAALVMLAAIAMHGLALLGDSWLHPGLIGIALPLQLRYRPGWTACGIVAGYLAVLIGPSFYVRRRIGAARWRKLHRASVLVWLLAAVHTVGAGSDAKQVWMRGVVLAPAIPAAYLLVLRLSRRRSGAAAASQRSRAHRPHVQVPAIGVQSSAPTPTGAGHQPSRGRGQRRPAHRTAGYQKGTA